MMINNWKLPLITGALFFIVFISKGQIDLKNSLQLSEKSVVSLITGSPGEELYTRFGHSAIRVYDPVNQIDLVYNYGTFDFDTPGFYSKFIRGKLFYSLSVYDFRYMIQSYQYRNQSLYEQQLDLTVEERQKVFEFLNNNYLPENRYYLYDYFFDNCSSRIRDVFEEVLGSKLHFNDDYIAEHQSFRKLIDKYLKPAPWGDFGIDFALGIKIDQLATSREYMFLPYEMMRAFGKASLFGDNGQYPFVKYTNVIRQEIHTAEETFLVTPKLTFWILFALIFSFSFIQYRKGKYNNWFDIFLFGIIGLAGLFIVFVFFGTNHDTAKENLNILWANPFNIILLVILLRKRYPKWINYYYILSVVLILFVLLGWHFLPQQFHPAIIPICLLLILRFGYLLWYNNKINHKKKIEHVE